MGAFVLTGAGQKIGDQEGGNEPCQECALQRSRAPTRHESDRSGCQHDQTAQQPWRNECAMAAGRQPIGLRQRPHQGIKMVADRSEQQVPCARLRRDALPLLIRRSCQRPLKRTLRRLPGPGGGRLLRPRPSALIPHSRGMVNGPLPACAPPAASARHERRRKSAFAARLCKRAALKSNAGEMHTIKILGKAGAHSSRIWAKCAGITKPQLQSSSLDCAH
jgi:hypothetical protein